MHRTLAAVVAVAVVGLGAVSLVACGGGESEDRPTDDAAPSTTSLETPGSTGQAADDGVAAECGTVRDDPADLDPELADLVTDLVTATGLLAASPYERFRVVCDTLGATSTEVPDVWGDQAPGPDDPPQSALIVGPDLAARVERHPVVGVGAARFVGDPPSAAFVNDNNAAGSLQSGTRVPRVGTSVAEGCTALEPVDFRIEGFTGEIQPYAECEGGDDPRTWLVAAAFPDDGAQFQAQLIGQARNTADLDALVRALATLVVDPNRVPGPELPPLPPLDSTG